MNIHHLELFYYVARHGGISAGVRNIPYGIQQPAVSGQILQLEKSLGQKLFHRRPFALTPAGRELFDFAQPFFGRVGEVARRLRSEEDTRLRMAAPATILRGYLPELLKEHQRKFPSLSLRLYDANQTEAERLLHAHEIDLAVTELEGKPAAGLSSAILFKLPLVFLVPARLKMKRAADFWRAGAQAPALISLPNDEVIAKQFQARLKRLNISWRSGIEVSALDLIPIYVSLGLGVGLSVRVPRMKTPKGLRILPLPGFPPLIVAALWRKNLSPSNAAFLAEIRRRAQELERQILQ